MKKRASSFREMKVSKEVVSEITSSRSAKLKASWSIISIWMVVIVGVIVFALLIGVVSWYFVLRLTKQRMSEDKEKVEDEEEAVAELEIRKAESCKQLREKLKLIYSSENRYNIDYGEGVEGGNEMGGSSPEIGFSQTNVQVEGIDEPDIVKNDDEYIYYAFEGVVKIVKAYPAEELALISTIKSDNASIDYLYVYKDWLVAIGGPWQVPVFRENVEKEILLPPYPYYSSVVEIWNIADKENPKLVKGWEFEGYFISSRLKDGEVYVVMQDYKYDVIYKDVDSTEGVIPSYREYGGEKVDMASCTDIWVPDTPWSRNYIEVVGIDLSDTTYRLSTEVVFGVGTIVYMSKNHIYVAGEYYPPIKPLDKSPLSWIFPPAQPIAKTVITKFDYGDGKVSYKGHGEISGYLLNQFSMDEYQGYLRVATTENRLDGDSSTNSIYILDDGLKVAGKVIDLAKGEAIYAVRFIGDKGYVVTFRQIDPLFVLDLSDPEDPYVVGELKIPGFSDYLHPWGKHYLIGFGMETYVRQSEEVEMKGIKIGLFDVSNPVEPKEIDKITIGGTGSTSEILYDHHALLVNEKEGWLAIPIEEVSYKPEYLEYEPGKPVPPHAEVVKYQGLYVFDVDTNKGILPRGKITHHDREDMTYRCRYEREDCHFWRRDIRRGIYIGEYIYAISDEAISGHLIEDLNLVKKVDWLNK